MFTLGSLTCSSGLSTVPLTSSSNFPFDLSFAKMTMPQGCITTFDMIFAGIYKNELNFRQQPMLLCKYIINK